MPIGLLLVLVVPQVATGLMAARARYVDDELAAAEAADATEKDRRLTGFGRPRWVRALSPTVIVRHTWPHQ